MNVVGSEFDLDLSLDIVVLIWKFGNWIVFENLNLYLRKFDRFNKNKKEILKYPDNIFLMDINFIHNDRESSGH